MNDCFFFKIAYEIGYVRLKVLFNFTKIKCWKYVKAFISVCMAYKLAKYIHRKLKVADSQDR